MTNQEIYDELGQRGIVMISCLAMMDSDGDIDKREANVIVNIALMLTNKDEAKANELIKKSVDAKDGLKTAHNIMEFVKAGARLFKELDEKIKTLYLDCLKAVAEADGKVTAEEESLYHSISIIIKGEGSEDNPKPVRDEALVEDDGEKGYPVLEWRLKKDEDGNKDEKLNDRIQEYLGKSPCPTYTYKGIHIETIVPSWIEELDNDNCCPQFSEKDMDFIISKIEKEKIIPILNYAPDAFHEATKRVWWIIPFSIWMGDVASWVFVDKNGIHAPDSDSDRGTDDDIELIFHWDALEDIYFSEVVDDDFELVSLDMVSKKGELTFHEFVPAGRGSYLKVIMSIYKIRKQTIEASREAGSWLEGTGGEKYQQFETPSDLLDENKWGDLNRPNSDDIRGGVQIDVKETKDADAIKVEDDENKGYPGLRVRIRKDENGNEDEKLNSIISKYLAKWQCPTESYNGRLGIVARVPSWIHKISTDDCCPQFSNNEIEFINNTILTEKTIPVLGYAPEEFYAHTKQPWWVVPFSIWAGDKASWIFIDKNGVYAAHPADEDIAMIFPWDRITDLDYQSEDWDTDEEEINSINFIFDEGELTLVEFVPPGRGSYLSVINSIYQIRKKTIEASAGESMWFEGAGGEGFKTFETPSDLVDEDKWKNPHRPNPAGFGGGFQIVEQETKDAEYFYNQGNKKFEKEDYNGAIEDFTKVIENKEADVNSLANSYRLRGDSKFELKDWKGAIADYDEVLKIAPDYANSLGRRGQCKLELKNYKGALEDLSKAIEFEPDQFAHYTNRGLAKDNLDDFKGALEDYNKAIAINPTWYGNYVNKGDVKIKLNDFQGAIEDYNRAIEAAPDSENLWECYLGCGNAKVKLEDYSGAIEDYNKVIELNPQHKLTYEAIGIAKSKINDYEGAIEAFTIGIDKGLGSVSIYYGRGLSRHGLGNFDQAIEDYNEAIFRASSAKIDYFYNLELAKNKLVCYTGDIELISERRQNSNLINAYFNKAKKDLEVNWKEYAIKSLDVVIELDPTFTEAYYTRAGIKYDLEDYEGAIVDYTETIKLDSSHTNAYSDRGYTKGMVDDYQGAITDLSKAIELDSSFTWAYKSRGEFKGKLKDYAGAILDYDKAIELDPEDIELIELRDSIKSLIVDKDEKSIQNESNETVSETTDETIGSITKVGNVILFSDFDSWIAEMRDGQEEDKARGLKKRKPIEIHETQEEVLRNLYDKINERFDGIEGSLTFSYSPTGGCTVTYNKKKVAGFGLYSKGNIELLILRDYKKGYIKPNIKGLMVQNIREAQISYKVPWGYAFFQVLDSPENINKNIEILLELIGDGIKTINDGWVLSLKKNEFRKLKPIFEGGDE